MAKTKLPFVSLAKLVAQQHPEIDDPEAAIGQGLVQVDGTIALNPRARVRRDAAVRMTWPRSLRGAAKLTAGLDHFAVDVAGLVALDLGASTGGFTSVLLERGARRIYAVDVGHGQLLGSLRQDERVRNLERTNVGELTRELVPDVVDVVTMDLSFLAIAEAIPQVEAVEMAPAAHLVALVKPQYELGAATLPSDRELLDEAVRHAVRGVERQRWTASGVIESPVRGGRGAIEFLLHARRGAGGTGS